MKIENLRIIAGTTLMILPILGFDYVAATIGTNPENVIYLAASFVLTLMSFGASIIMLQKMKITS